MEDSRKVSAVYLSGLFLVVLRQMDNLMNEACKTGMISYLKRCTGLSKKVVSLSPVIMIFKNEGGIGPQQNHGVYRTK